jgi:hypothetical protein
MPHASVKLKPGVDVTETPALNEAGISSSNLIRFLADRNGIGLIQKLGGWTKYYSSQMVAKVRALLAWEDTNANSHLGFGTTIVSGQTYSQLGVITDGTLRDITPTYSEDDVTPAVSATSGSSLFTITDTVTPGITIYDSVYIQTQLSVGGVVLFGLYACTTVDSTHYIVQAKDKLGVPIPATSTTTTTSLPDFTATAGTNLISVTLPDHGFVAGDTFPVLLETVVGDVTLFGNYIVLDSGLTTNTFEFFAANKSVTGGTATLNNGDAHYLYSYGTGAPITSTGYGAGGYGDGGYGTGVPVTAASGDKISATDWTLDNWGEILVACATRPQQTNTAQFQPIYIWSPTSGEGTAVAISTAPPVNDGIFVAMPQRQIVAWGSTFTGIQDPLLIRWCDANNLDVWVAQYTNQAGSFRIPRGSRVVACIQGPQQGLVWTDLGLWTMQYIGQPYVYSFNEVGFGCGLIGHKAAAVINDVVFWMSGSQFFTLASNGVKPVPCPVWDVIFQDLDTDHTDLIRTAVNSRFNEVTWYYPTKSSGGEVNAYVKLNVALLEWDYGTLARSAWIDQSVVGKPVGADPNTLYLYQHETSNDADGAPLEASFTTGYFAMSEADVKTFVDQVWPDMKWGEYGGAQSATVNLTFNVADYPGQTPTTFGPYPMTVNTTFITPRFRGRLVSISLSSNDIGSFWRIGNIRYRLQQDGKF